MGERAYSETDHNANKKIERIQGITLNDVFIDYTETTTLRPNTLAAYKLAVERDLRDWKDKPLTDITGDMVQRRHKALSKESETRANKAMRTLRALFNFARDQYEDSTGHSLFPDNPTRKLKRQWHKETRRKGYITHHQLPEWFKAVESLPDKQQRGDGVLARDYLVFVLLTGLRRREATSLLWSDIDLKARRFIVRDPKNHDDLWMPLPNYLVDMLSRRKDDTKADRPFQLDDPRRFVQKVRDLSEVHFTVHDLRRTFITIAESLDIGVYTIKALVNHRSGSNDVTEGYVQINTERLREPMNRITDFILAAGGVRESAEVVDLATANRV
jgi:integrase